MSTSPLLLDIALAHARAHPRRVLFTQPIGQGQVVDIAAQYGNQIAASIPFTLDLARQTGRVRPGDRISNRQVLASVSGPKTTKLGTGRFWVIDVEFHNQRDELVGIETYTGFGYVRGAA